LLIFRSKRSKNSKQLQFNSFAAAVFRIFFERNFIKDTIFPKDSIPPNHYVAL